MLEFLGFIALIAIIFGVSFTSALTGFFKAVAIGFAIIMALDIIAKMLESKTGAWFVLIGAAIAVYSGILGINTDRTKTLDMCSPLAGTSSFAYCLSSGAEADDEKVNKGWGYAICGGLAALASCVALSGFYNEENPKKNVPKTHSAV